MASKYQKTTIKEDYTLKVRQVGEDSVRVSMFEGNGREIIGDMPRGYFPSGRELKAGDILKYTVEVNIQCVPIRRLSAAEIRSIERDVERRLPKGEF